MIQYVDNHKSAVWVQLKVFYTYYEVTVQIWVKWYNSMTMIFSTTYLNTTTYKCEGLPIRLLLISFVSHKVYIGMSTYWQNRFYKHNSALPTFQLFQTTMLSFLKRKSRQNKQHKKQRQHWNNLSTHITVSLKSNYIAYLREIPVKMPLVNSFWYSNNRTST